APLRPRHRRRTWLPAEPQEWPQRRTRPEARDQKRLNPL
ncbi:MAG: hypothetical protein AVDCRST_MAG86-2096, partial [uncultured Truepera sp.]